MNDQRKTNHNSNNHPSLLPYVCVYCGTPCAALYTQLGTSLSSMQALKCTQRHCQELLDPFMEREWLLVAIDIILLRPEAYRHVLFNSLVILEVTPNDNNVNDTNHDTKEKKKPIHMNDENTLYMTFSRAVQYMAASSILHSYLQYESIRQQQQPSSNATEFHRSFTAFQFVKLIVISMIELMIQCTVTFGCLQAATTTTLWNLKQPTRNDLVNTVQKQKQKQQRIMQIICSVLLPTAFQVVVIFVMNWENSKTTRALGSLLILSWQSLAVYIVVLHHQQAQPQQTHQQHHLHHHRSNKTNFGDEAVAVMVMVVGIIWAPILWRWCLSKYYYWVVGPNMEFACVGFELSPQQLVHDVVGLFHSSSSSSHHGGFQNNNRSLPLPSLPTLCLT